jgi:serine protease
MPVFSRIPLLLIFTVVLSACGGGGGSDAGAGSSTGTVPAGDADATRYTVSVTSSEGGTGTPEQQEVEAGAQAAVSLLADSGYELTGASGCDGQLTGSEYLTGPVNADCEITAVFEPLQGAVAGQIMPPLGTAVDYTVNDPLAPLGANTSCATAQPIENRVTLHGFASASATGGDPAQEHFADSANPRDFYRSTLDAGQVIELEVADDADLELRLWNADCSQLLESWTDGTSQGRVVSLLGGENVVEVRAQTGISKYVMRVTTAWESGLEAEELEQLSLRLPDFIPGEVIVTFAPGAGGQPHGKLGSALENAQGLRVRFKHDDPDRPTLARVDSLAAVGTQALKSAQLERLRSAGKNAAFERLATLRAADFLARQPGVRAAEPNFIVRSQRVPNDPYYADQWHYEQVRLPEAWDSTVGESANGQDVVVAVIDSGVYLGHEDFQGKLLPGWDFHDDDADPDDANTQDTSKWHGTHVAGSIAAATDNNTGVAGSSWGAVIMPVRVLGDDSGSRYDVIQGARYAAGLSNDSGQLPERPADVINLSLGGGGYSSTEQALYDDIRSAGIHVVAAAGNENSDEPMYPAAYNGVLSVSATNCARERASYSNYGSTITLAAPGGDTSACSLFRTGAVVSTVGSGSGDSRSSAYGAKMGTSMAAPHVSGVLALMLALYPELSPTQVEFLLEDGTITDDLGAAGRDDQFGHGLINARKAVEAAQALANGEMNWSARVVADPASLSLGYQSEAEITLIKEGEGEAPAVVSASGSADWLTVTAQAVDERGLGSYQVSVDRSLFSESESGHYEAEAVFALEDSSSVSVRVHIQVGYATEAAPVYVLLLDPTSRETRYQTLAEWSSTGELRYQMDRIDAGDYVLVAGSDIDADNFICQTGESCGAYPDYATQEVITVSDGELKDLHIPLDILGRSGTFESPASAGISRQ